MTETMQPPTYLEIVERHGLEILNRPADLVLTATGDIAVTKSGDLMLLSAERSAMFRLVHGWRFNAPTLHLLFDRVSTIRRRRKELDDSLDAWSSGWSDPVILGRYRELRDENPVAWQAYRGAVRHRLATGHPTVLDAIGAAQRPPTAGP